MNLFKKYYLFFLFILCLFVNAGVAQQYNFKNYNVKNGLAASVVNSVFQDSKGYLWFGTQGGGVSRFNGKTFTNFNKNDGLISNDVTYITEDKLGNIWIATAEGVSKFDGIKFYNFSEKESLFRGSVYWIYVDENNILWFANTGVGVVKYDGIKFTAITVKDGLPSNNVYCIVQDKNKDYWFGLSNGVAKYDGSRVVSYDKVAEVNNKVFFSALVDSKGNVWFGGADKVGVVRYSGNKFEKIKLPEEVQDDFFGSIAEDDKGNIWFATYHGVLKYEKNKFYLFTETQGLSSNGVLSIGKDYEGNIWIGTQHGGVNLFNNESFVNFNDKSGLNSNNITAISQYDENEYVVGTSAAGINIYDSKRNIFTPLSHIKEIQSVSVYYTMRDNQGKLWLGTQEGVFVLDKTQGQFKLHKIIHKLGEEKITAALKIIQSKKDNSIWVATYGTGLFCLNGNNVKHYCSPEFESSSSEENQEDVKEKKLVSDQILTVFEDSKLNIWIGTQDHGVMKYDRTGFKTYTTKDGLAGNAIWSIAEDTKGNLYFGTGENGISCYDGKIFKTISTQDKLCANYIPVLIWDSMKNCLWAGTNKGVNQVKFKNQFEILSLRYYGEQEGFKGVEVNQNAIMLDKQGMVWFGCNNGLGRYNSKYDFPNVTSPKLQLSGIRLAYQKVDWKKQTDSVDSKTGLPFDLDLSYKNNNLTFDFQALTTDNVQYTFILEGQDDEWSPLSTTPQAVFTNIAPGKKYTFKVKALNSNGVWSKDTIEYSFAVSPPWWQTWWFYSISIILIIASVYTYINYRTAQLAKEKKVLEEKVAERTVELKGANDRLSVAFNDIKDSINYAKKIQDAILPLDEEIKKDLPQSFVLFKPRDVVSGDFYWFNKKDDQVYIAAVDCTGHGVPGAFMSMIGNSLLNEIVSTKGAHDAASILKQLHQGVRKSLKQDRDSYESKDGMDLALAVIDTTKNTLQYSGAKRSLYCFLNNEFSEVKADKQSIGGLEMEDNYTFTNHNFDLKKGDTFYLFTDGYVDQFGGENGKKFSSKRLKETLEQMQSLSLREQGQSLDKTIEDWKSNIEQIDDILVIGIRF